MNKCKCGCGGAIIIKPHHSYCGIPNYIWGHNRKGQHHAEETKQRIGQSNAKVLMGRSWAERSGEKVAEQRRFIQSERSREMWRNSKFREKRASESTGKRNSFFGKHHSKESRRKMSASHIGVPLSDEHTRAIVKANNLRPNKTEVQLLSFLGSPWQFVGNGQLVIGGKCPDFWDGDNKLIELFGDYWHKDENPRDRIEHFKRYGYDCDVIWEHTLREICPDVKEKDGLERLEI